MWEEQCQGFHESVEQLAGVFIGMMRGGREECDDHICEWWETVDQRGKPVFCHGGGGCENRKKKGPISRIEQGTYVRISVSATYPQSSVVVNAQEHTHTPPGRRANDPPNEPFNQHFFFPWQIKVFIFPCLGCDFDFWWWWCPFTSVVGRRLLFMRG